MKSLIEHLRAKEEFNIQFPNVTVVESYEVFYYKKIYIMTLTSAFVNDACEIAQSHVMVCNKW